MQCGLGLKITKIRISAQVFSWEFCEFIRRIFENSVTWNEFLKVFICGRRYKNNRNLFNSDAILAEGISTIYASQFEEMDK